MRYLVLAALLGIAGWLLWTKLMPKESAPGAFLKSEPSQEYALPIPFKRGNFTFYPVASFQVDARVFGRLAYDGADFESQISPVDLALGWGPLADEGVASQISITQGDRFYYWRSEQLPLSTEVIGQSSANMHIIPASPDVTRFLDTVSPGQKISLKGKLVNVRGPERWGWATSTTRNDTGDGACEVFYVEKASQILSKKTDTAQAALPVASSPQNIRSLSQSAAPVEVRITLTKTKTFPIRYGTLTIPAGDAVRIAAEKGSKVKAVYRGIEFWVERKELD